MSIAEFIEQFSGGILLIGVLILIGLLIHTWLEGRKKEPDEHQFFPPPY
jgi:hypothetical protein